MPAWRLICLTNKNVRLCPLQYVTATVSVFEATALQRFTKWYLLSSFLFHFKVFRQVAAPDDENRIVYLSAQFYGHIFVGRRTNRLLQSCVIVAETDSRSMDEEIDIR